MNSWLTRSWKTLSAVVGMVIILSTAVGGIVAADARYAKADYVSIVEERLNVKIIQDRIDAIQERMWNIEDRWNERYKKEHNEYPKTIDILKSYMDKDTRETYRKLEEELEDLETELESIKKKQKE